MDLSDKQIRVLLVEDNPGDIRLTRMALLKSDHHSFKVEIAERLSAAIELLHKNCFDIALVDLSLPDSRGLSIISKISAENSKIPIVVLTGLADEEIGLQALQEGAEDYLIKGPQVKNFLTHSVRYAIGRKKIKQALYESEKRFRELFENSPDAIFVEDFEGNVLDVNPEACRLHAMVYEELIGKNVTELVPENKKKEVIRDFNNFTHGENNHIEAFSHTKDGRDIPVEIMVSQINYMEKAAVLLHVRDITERKQVEEELQKHREHLEEMVGQRTIELEKINEQLQQEIVERKKTEDALRKSELNYRTLFEELTNSNKKLKQTQSTLIHQEKLAAIGQLAAGVAHELNNPLGFITSNFATLQNDVKIIEECLAQYEDVGSQIQSSGNSGIMEAFEKIEQFKKVEKLDFILEDLNDLFDESSKGFNQMAGIVQGLRSFSRVDFNNEVDSYDINSAIEDTLIVAKNGYKYIAEIEKDFAKVPLIECRGSEINQVLLNIIVNAAQAIESQNKAEFGKIAIKTYAKGEYVYCEISDTGPGIPAEIITKIFDPFFTTKKVGKGTGLGLNISYDIIVNKHGGALMVKSETDTGVTFTIKLPIKFSRRNIPEDNL